MPIPQQRIREIRTPKKDAPYVPKCELCGDYGVFKPTQDYTIAQLRKAIEAGDAMLCGCEFANKWRLLLEWIEPPFGSKDWLRWKQP